MQSKNSSSPVAQIPTQVERLVGSYSGNRTGDLILVFAGIHGNEISGVKALREVFVHLERTKPSFHGKVVGLIGNVAAVESGQRFIEKDLNRNWTPEHVDHLRQTDLRSLQSEDAEARQLLELIDEACRSGDYHNYYFIDLHATSAPGGGFSILDDTEANRQLAARLHLPAVFGLEKKLHCTLANYLYNRGFSGVAFEGGQIGSEEAVDVHRAGLWMLLSGLGCLHPKSVENYRELITTIMDASEGLPQAVCAHYRHHIDKGDQFVMKPGFQNFMPVKAGDHLADDRYGKVEALFDGLLLMPLYQSKGEDGFFIVKPTQF